MKKGLAVMAMLTLGISQAQILLPYQENRLLISKTGKELVIDGKLEEGFWGQVASLPFIRFRPDWGEPDDRTVMKVTFDDRYLYVGAICLFPDSVNVISRNLVRDGWQGDDFFTFHIDSYDDKQNAFVFSIYPPGSRYDMTVSNDGIELGNSTFNATYDMLWEGASSHLHNGWSLEMKIPLSNLRFQRAKDGNIYSNISGARTINGKNELYVFPAIPQEIQGDIMRPSAKQPVIFDGLEPKKQLLVTPYLLAGKEAKAQLNESENDYFKDRSNVAEVGLDVRYSLSSKMTLDLTYNTDFSQVEADDQVVNLQRFSVIFPEKRRFFQEQAGLYEVKSGWPTQLFYSRNIGIFNGQLAPIVGGGRLNGKVGTWDLGLLSIQTGSNRLIDGTMLPSENFGALRLRKKVLNDRSFIGFLSTSRFRSTYQNILWSSDAILNLHDDVYLTTSVSYAFDSDVSQTLTDNAQFFLGVNNNVASGWIYDASYHYSGSTFTPGVGFLARSNFHKLFAQLDKGQFNRRGEGLLQYSKFTWFNTDLFYSADRFAFETWYSLTGLEGRTFANDNFEVFHIREYQRLTTTLHFSDGLFAEAGDHFFHYGLVGYSPAQRRRFNHRASVSFGSFYGGSRLSLQYAPRLNLGKHLNLSGTWRSNFLDFSDQEAGMANWLHLIRLKLEMALDLHLSASMLSQYNTSSKSFFNNARVRYNFRDGHDLYLVYNEIFNEDRRREEPVLPVSAQQTFILKYIYTFYR